MSKGLFIISIFSLAVCSCTPKLQSDTGQGGYYEDLSAYRPVIAGNTTTAEEIADGTLADIVPKHHINDTLNAVLDSISVLSHQIKYIKGYTVQIYSGNSRESANITSGEATALLEIQGSDLLAEVSYKVPNFKVQVGKFFSTLDAHTVRVQLLRKFPNAIVVLRKFPIKKD